MRKSETSWVERLTNTGDVAYPFLFVAGMFTMLYMAADVLQQPSEVRAWILLTGSFTIGFVVRPAFSREIPSQTETRARVREAEQSLEEALRGSAAGSDSDVATEAPSTPQDPDISDDNQARLTLSELWAVTHRRLDHYHGIALGQATRSFRNAQVAMGLGFALLVAFVIVALNASTTAGSVVAGGLGAVSAALAGYVSRTFIRSQEAAAGHLRAYFDQPLEFSRYLGAERLMADARLGEEKRAEILSLLVQTMIAGPAGPALTSSVEEESGKTS